MNSVVARVQNVDRDTLANVFVELQDRLRAYLSKYVARDAVDDLLQDVFVKALKAIDGQHAPRKLPAWLFSTARTTAIDYLRADNKSFVELESANLSDSSSEQNQVERSLATCLQPLAEQMPAIYRDTLLATDFAGETMRAVAAKEAVSVSAIKSRAARGRAMLKRLLLDCCRIEVDASGVVVDYSGRDRTGCC